MSRTILIECSPRWPSDGVVVPVRLVFKSVARANFFGVQWHPAVISVPAFESSLGFDGRTFAAAPSPQIGDLVFALTQATRFAASLVWTNAAVTMKHALWPAAGGDAIDGDFATIWTGQAEDITTSNGEARVRLLDNGQALRVPAVAAKFGSTGDALLDSADALKDRSAETRVPRAWGKLLSIPALLVDRANNIWLFAGNAATSVQAFYDGGAAFTLGTARASLAALQANVPAAGAVDYCLDAGGKFLARPWSTPVYPFTAAATFGATTAAGIASAIVTGRTSVTFTAGTVTAFNTLQGADCGLYLDDDTSVAAALDRLFSGLGAWWRLSSAGTITLGRWGWSTPALTVPAHRHGAPDRLRILAPTRRRSLGYARNDRVHSESEIARILLATDLAYADGTAIEALKPAVAGATRDRTGTLLDAAAAANEAAGWFTSGGASTQFNSTTGGFGAFINARMVQIDLSSAFDAYNLAMMPVGGTGRQFASIRYTHNGTGSVALPGSIVFYDAGGTFVSAEAFALPRVTAGVYSVTTVSAPVPAGAAYWRVRFNSAAMALDAGATWRIDNIVTANNEPGADVTATSTPDLSVPGSAVINFDYTGTVISGDLPRNLVAVRTRGGVDVSSSTTWSVTAIGCTASINSSGQISITACGSSGSIEVTSSRDGTTLTKTIMIDRRVGAAPSGGGGGGGTTATDSSLDSFSSSTYGAAVGGPMTVRTGASGQIDLYANLDFIVSATTPGGSFGAYIKWQWRIVGGSYADAGAEAAEIYPCVITNEGGGFFTRDDGGISCNRTLTGLSASTDYEVQLLARTPSGTRARTLIGTISGVGS